MVKLCQRESCREHFHNSQTPGVASSATSSLACSPAAPSGSVQSVAGFPVVAEGCACLRVSEEKIDADMAGLWPLVALIQRTKILVTGQRFW